MSEDLYEPCPLCGPGSGRYAEADPGPCVSCGGHRFIKIGLTRGQVERMAALELAGARVWFGDSGVGGPDRYTVRWHGRRPERFEHYAVAAAVFSAPNP